MSCNKSSIISIILHFWKAYQHVFVDCQAMCKVLNLAKATLRYSNEVPETDQSIIAVYSENHYF